MTATPVPATSAASTPGWPLPVILAHRSYAFRASVAVAIAIPLSLLGIIVSGDLDGLTIYTDRYGRKIGFPQAPPLSPPSPVQIWQRDRFRAAAAQWQQLSPPDRAAYHAATQTLSLCMPPTGLFFHFALCWSAAKFATVCRQSGQTLIPPTPIP